MNKNKPEPGSKHITTEEAKSLCGAHRFSLPQLQMRRVPAPITTGHPGQRQGVDGPIRHEGKTQALGHEAIALDLLKNPRKK